MTKKQASDFDATRWLAQMRQSGLEFVLFGLAGQPQNIHYRYPPQQGEWVENVVTPLILLHKGALIAALQEEGRQRQAALQHAEAAPPVLRLCA